MRTPHRFSSWFPPLRWAPGYGRQPFTADAVAAGVVTLMLIPQSLAYAQLAGLPAHTGLYAAMLPLVLYALLGSSAKLSVGPAAVTSLMTASALGSLAAAPGLDITNPAVFHAAALWLALISGGLMLAMGLLRMGFLANFLSHPVVSGFVSATGLLIAAGQLKHLLGLPLKGDTVWAMGQSLWAQPWHIHPLTAAYGLASLAALLWAKRRLKPTLRRMGLPAFACDTLAKAAPIAVLAVATAVAAATQAHSMGLKTVGHIPGGLPTLAWPGLPTSSWAGTWQALWLPAVLIALVGFVESVSIGQSLAAKTRDRIDPNAELRGLGLANVGAAVSGGFPITGGLSRSVVNHDAGAATPAAGLLTAGGLALASLFLTPGLVHLPQAALAATIWVSVLGLVDARPFAFTWRYAKSDFTTLALTFGTTLLAGVELGLLVGVASSLMLLLYRSSQPHVAIVGQVPGTEHYRNVQRHRVITHPHIVGLRVDESLYFANTRYLEDRITHALATHPEVRHVVLQCSAINDIDASALESLCDTMATLHDAGIALHLSEVKGPVMDRLQRCQFLPRLTGQVFLTHHQAITTLSAG